MQQLRRRAPDVASAAECDRHFPHLVARAPAKADVIRYWYALRGPSLISYDRKAARLLFDGIVAGAGARLKKAGS
jgi:hypothetical protein